MSAGLPEHAVAVVGVAGRFPGAADARALWRNLVGGVESVTFFDDETLRAAGVPDALLANPAYVRAKPVLDDAECFDAAFFGYTPREAELIDPQQRVFLECAWHAIEDAGHDPRGIAAPVGVFAGMSMSAYAHSAAYRRAVGSRGGLDLVLGTDKDFLSTRVSYELDLTGPGLTVQTACSTSLVAVALACQSLVDYQCDAALAGGVSVRIPRITGYLYQDGGIASPDGHCRPFDARAAGTIGGEGVAVVMLKRLADALADGDPVRAVIRGWALNNDGARKVGFTAPGVDTQSEVVATAQALAEVEPETISYVEAHGTGTALGDPIEIAALARAFATDGPRARPCLVGSVKSNLGHLDAAAGVTGLVKTVLALEHRTIPATLHFTAPNPDLRIETTPFRIADRTVAWECEGPRRAGVSSFGIGGTNAHVVVEEAPVRVATETSRPHEVLVLSARTRTSLAAMAEALAARFDDTDAPALGDAAHTLAVGRHAFDLRLAVAATTAEEASRGLRAAAASVADGGGRAAVSGRRVAFLFPGQGAQHPGMGRDLYHAEPVYRAVVDACAERLIPALGLDLRELLLLAPDADPVAVERAAERLRATAVAQPALFVVEYALARLCMAYGVTPDAMLGHSIGEYVAACLAGVMDESDALALVAARGALMQSLPGGSMLAVPMPVEAVAPLLADGVEVAAINEPGACVVSGPTAAVDALRATLAAQGIEGRALHTSHAFHSPMMEPILEAFAARVREVPLRAPEIPYVSNLTGTWITAEAATDPDYWCRHLRHAVRFADGVAVLLESPQRVIVEVGPGAALGALVGRHPQRVESHTVLAAMRHPRRPEPDTRVLVQALGAAWCAGVAVDWSAWRAEYPARRVSLPGYAFERRRYLLVDAPAVGDASVEPAPSTVFSGERLPLDRWLNVPVWRRGAVTLVDATPSTAAGSASLVLAEPGPLGDAVCAALATGGPVVRVRPGSGFADDGETLTLAPSVPEDHRHLARALRARGLRPRRLVVLWAAEGSCTPEDAVARAFHAPLLVVQALAQDDPGLRLDVVVATRGAFEVTGTEALTAEHATATGPVRAIPGEYPGIACRLVDLPGAAEVGARDWRAAAVLREVSDLGSGPTRVTADRVCAWRGGYRWTLGFEPLPSTEPVRPSGGGRGCLLVTGGLGGIGLTLAGHLTDAQARGARAVVLVSRSGLQAGLGQAETPAVDPALASRLAAVAAIEARGVEVVVEVADVADAAAMRAVVARAVARFGSVDAVVHAAGVPAGGVVHLERPETLDAVLAPKVRGTRVLLDALRGQRPRFVALCGSLAAHLDIPGQASYVAANAFLDAVAAEHRRGAEFPVVAVDWDTWAEVGMAVAAVADRAADDAGRMRVERGITPAEGGAILDRALAAGQAQVAVCTERFTYGAPVMLPGAAPGGETTADIDHQPAEGRPETSTPYAAPQTPLEKAVVRIWEEAFGYRGLGVDDDFFDLGGHSLLAVQIVSRLGAELGLTLTVEALFEAPTVRALVRRAEGEGSSPDAAGDGMDDVMDLVEQLSEEEVLRMLGER
ncbi:MAG: SDR family NAD(P)-dependent oxidoreductase [Chromatiales bacterium]|nr:SDR family NAD(P)-dependent oxidoreductase [Chromatiales bacterium]